MGSEVSKEHFSAKDFVLFKQRLQQETDFLLYQMNHGGFSHQPPVAGFEVEACFINKLGQPAPINETFLKLFNHSMATPELAKFNMELNTQPQVLENNVLQIFDLEIHKLLKQANSTAQQLDAQIFMSGILPTLQLQHFRIENMSDMKRYHALNELILKSRQEQPLHFDIHGHETLTMDHDSVMLEAATTSMQLHLQVPIESAHHYYNASIMVSAPIMAITGNAPFLFGKELWHETRIPMFEQAIHLGNTPQRVSFGTGYVAHIQQCFIENNEYYPVILPMVLEEPIEKFANLSLHNGVVWRWNRPLVGFDLDGKPHIRIEHRVMPAGPSVVDMIANAALYYGLTQYFANHLKTYPIPIEFTTAKNNFYLAAQHGIKAKLNWNNREVSAQELLVNELLEYARQGLQQLNINTQDIENYLAIIEARTESGQTGAVWQIEHAKKINYDMPQLTLDYLQNQQSEQPVHLWAH